jgi:hypothetical protein
MPGIKKLCVVQLEIEVFVPAKAMHFRRDCVDVITNDVIFGLENSM